MKGRGTRLCEDIDKRYFTIFDYSGASQLEDAEFDGHPANLQKAKLPKSKPQEESAATPRPKPVGEGVSVVISASDRYVCLADGRKIPFEEYTEQSREFILDVSHQEPRRAADASGSTRRAARNCARSCATATSTRRPSATTWTCRDTDDVDILAKIGFDLPRVPNRADRGRPLLGRGQTSGCSPSSARADLRRGSRSRFKAAVLADRASTTTRCSASTIWSRPDLRRPAVRRAVRQLHNADQPLRRPGRCSRPTSRP